MFPEINSHALVHSSSDYTSFLQQGRSNRKTSSFNPYLSDDPNERRASTQSWLQLTVSPGLVEHEHFFLELYGTDDDSSKSLGRVRVSEERLQPIFHTPKPSGSPRKFDFVLDHGKQSRTPLKVTSLKQLFSDKRNPMRK